jgi:protein SCO1/2
MRWFVFTLGILATCVAGCAPASPPVNAAGGAGRYPISGTVIAQPSASTVTLAHDAIANVMPAMVMDFHGEVLPPLQNGDRVRATLVVTGDESRITDIAVVAVASAPGQSSGAPGVAAPPGSLVPDADLRTQHDRPVRVSDYRGRVLLVTFIYTRCPLPDFCPRLMRNFSELRRALASRPDVSSQVHLLSVTIDPAFDTPRVLRAYGEALLDGPDPFDRWDLATGHPDEVRKLADFVGLTYEPESGTIRHSMDTAIIGADGRLVKRFPGTTWDQQLAISIVTREAARANPINHND